MVESVHISVARQGLHPITLEIESVVKLSAITMGLCTIFVRHTSASLLIQENADASARLDLEKWLNRLVPENDQLYTHTCEGPDDMSAHIKSTLTATSLFIPIINSALGLGIWQGIYLWEHRHASCTREVLVHIGN